MAWPPEAARFMMVAVTMFGSSIAIRQLEHAGITFLVDVLPPRLRLTLYLLGNLSIAIFLAIFAYFSWRMTAEMGVRQVSSSLGMPMTVAYISMPVGGVMMLVQLLAASIEGLARFKSGGTPFASELQEAAPLSQGKSSV
jgi:TRAP-type C4-dicarboxylate transport system permease small subunit